MYYDSLFYYKNLFFIELLVAEFLYAFNLKKKDNFLLRFIITTCISITLCFVTPIISNDALYTSLMFFVMFIISIISMLICYDEKFINIIFCAFAAYTTQHLSYGVANFLTTMVSGDKTPMVDLYTSTINELFTFDLYFVLWFVIYILSYVIVYSLTFIWYNSKIKNRTMKVKSVSVFVLVSLGILVDIVFNTITIYHVQDKDSVILTGLYNTLSCFLLLYIQFNLLHTYELEHELDFVRKMWDKEKEQYLISKEHIDIINIKCHDMKHQIRKIKNNENVDGDIIKELENAVGIYDSIAKTGNEALDVILTEKALYCHKNDIILTYVADGAKLSFMVESDIYSLFGNALDNAIESVLKIEEKERRIIELTIRQVNEFVSISIKNSFEGKINFDSNGMPITTKSDTTYHGYGVKSISLIVDKYDGNVSFGIKNEIFNLSILLPLK